MKAAKNLKSKYHLGIAGIRAKVTGKSSQALKKEGWIKLNHADQNNYYAFDWVKFAITRDQFMAKDWSVLSSSGMEGIAIWITDAQWGEFAPITKKQWENRAMIELFFNQKHPHGRVNDVE